MIVPGDVHVNRPLVNVSVAYARQANFIADKVFPVVPVQNVSNMFRRYTRDAWFKPEAKERAPATPTVGGSWKFTLDTYQCRVYAFHADIDDQTLRNADAEFNLDRDATEYVTQQLLLTRESLWQSAFFKTGVWGYDFTGVAAGPTAVQFVKWSVGGSTPIEDIKAQILRMTRRTGIRPNVMVMAPDVANTLELHAEIIDRIKYVQRGIVGMDILSAMFGIDKIYVPDVIINSAPEVQADTEGVDTNFDFIYSGGVWLGYAAPRAGLMTQSAGYVFVWVAYSGYGARVKKYRIEPIESNRVEGDMAFDLKVVSPNLGTFMAAAI